MNKTVVLVDVPPNQPVRKNWWRVIRRILKYAIQCVLLVALLIMAVSWFRSYHKMSDWLAPSVFGTQKSFFVGADRGTIYMSILGDESPVYAIVTSSRFSPFMIEGRSEGSRLNERESQFQFGYFTAIKRSVSTDFYSTINSYVVRLQPLSGHGIYFPHCIAMIMFGTFFVLITFGRRFTLRGVMIWITVVCLLMGIQIAAANYQPQEVQGVTGE